MPATLRDYAPGNAPQPVGGEAAPEKKEEKLEYWPLEKCRKAYTNYLDNKQEEIAEQKNARRYYHGVHWTEEQVKALNKRKQPVVTFNRIARKLNGVVGLIERLKQDPKAYPRTPKHEEGADLATAVIRYVLDSNEWAAKSPEVALDCAVEGFAGISIELTERGEAETPGSMNGDRDDAAMMGQADYEVGFAPIEADSFFYDPRSYRPDFSDARYMGEAKWLDLEVAQEMFPDHADELEAALENSSELSTNPDRENKFFMMEGGKQLVRLVDCWYTIASQGCSHTTGEAAMPETMEVEAPKTEVPINIEYDIPPKAWVPGTVVPKDTALEDMTDAEYVQWMYENLTPFWAIRVNLLIRKPAVISSLEPATAAIGDPSFRLVVSGTGFIKDTSIIVFAGQDENTAFDEEDGTLSTGVNMDYWHGPAAVPVRVRNMSVYSEPVDFTFTAAAPEAAVAVDENNGIRKRRATC